MKALYRQTATCLLAVSGLIVPQQVAVAAQQDLQRFRPTWQVGDSWVVETTHRQQPIRGGRPHQLKWRFRVQGRDTRQGRKCLRVEVFPATKEPAPPTATMWYDAESKTLRQLDVRLAVPAGSRKASETFAAAGGQPFPVVTSLTTLPVELPLFQTATKSNQTFVYVANNAPAQQKTASRIGFAHEVTQRVELPDAVDAELPARIRGFTKAASSADAILIVLRTARGQVRQHWRAGLPWPVTTDNGTVRSRLISVQTAPRANTASP